MYYFEQDHCQDKIKDILINRPLSLLAGDKLNFIIFMIKKYRLTNILEVGTFAGGTSYLLSKELPDSQITTIDLNNFEEYFKQPGHDKILKSIKEGYYDLDIDSTSIRKIQKIYKSMSSNVRYLTGNLTSIDISNFDAVIIDGDHTIEGLISDLNYSFKNMKSGLIFVDDCVHAHIKQCCEEFCKANNIEYEFSVHCSYGEISGTDLCVIKKLA